MSIGRKSSDENWEKSIIIHEDDPQALEKLTARLAVLESEVPRRRDRITYVKKRIAYFRSIDRMQHEVHSFPGGIFITNEKSNRIEFRFFWAPDKDVEERLRKRGFHQWSVYLWQAPRNPKYLQRANRILNFLVEPYTEPDFREIPLLKAQLLLFYLRALQEALERKDEPVGENEPVQEERQETLAVEPVLDTPAAEQTPEPPAVEEVREIPAVQPKKRAPSYDLKTIRERVGEMPGTEMTVKGISSPLVWVSGDTKPYKEELKALGGRWSPKKAAWYIRPDVSKSSKK